MSKEPARQRKWVGRRYPRGGDMWSREGWEARRRLVEGPEGSPTVGVAGVRRATEGEKWCRNGRGQFFRKEYLSGEGASVTAHV